nr:MAG TPA: hypothetical protein [Caudoviricetes sp.]
MTHLLLLEPKGPCFFVIPTNPEGASPLSETMHIELASSMTGNLNDVSPGLTPHTPIPTPFCMPAISLPSLQLTSTCFGFPPLLTGLKIMLPPRFRKVQPIYIYIYLRAFLRFIVYSFLIAAWRSLAGTPAVRRWVLRQIRRFDTLRLSMCLSWYYRQYHFYCHHAHKNRMQIPPTRKMY